MEMPCDILIPAAVERSINNKNAPNLQCKVVVEGANGPTTFMGEEILNERGIIVVPDMLVNVGGVTVSYFEWLKDLSHMRFGRMDKRYRQQARENTIRLIEDMTNRKVNKDMFNRFKSKFIHFCRLP